VIVGGGAAGLAAADMLRREGYDGPLTIVSADASPPVDRPNLSKDYMAGTALEERIPLRPSDYYRDRRIDLLLHSRVSSLDTERRRIVLEAIRSQDRFLTPFKSQEGSNAKERKQSHSRWECWQRP
jgi:NADPH-dependent 2,4-dienoyl-CoA reductase/sulfur reductase-like enzyme